MIKAKKKFGQNFLTDTSVIKQIIDYINPKENDRMLEIGPGMGALTKPLLSKIKHINVIEIDSDMVAHLKNTIADDQITILENDILMVEKQDLSSYDRIIGNLPYYISTEIMIKMIDLIDNKKDFHFMFQKEVAERISAVPGTKSYGRLTVLIQYFFTTEILLHIPSNAFTPAPKIQSSFMRLIPKKNQELKYKNINNFKKIIKAAFQHKRKTIKNNFKDILNEKDFNFLKINPQDRAEMLSIDTFVNIENYMYDNNISL
jgi:16S rRNA (adenine1518-N6/adenine1519-N6)-dimethyltransferase